MGSFLNRFAEGKAKGLVLWFTRQHVKGCGPCRMLLDDLRENMFLLRQARSQIDAKTMERLSAAVSEAAKGVPGDD